MDATKFESELRKEQALAKQAMQNGGAHVPQSFTGAAAKYRDILTGTNQEARQGGGLLDGLAGKFPMLGFAISGATSAFGSLKVAMSEALAVTQKAEMLGTTTGFIVQLGKAARRSGEDAATAETGFMRFEQKIGQMLETTKGLEEFQKKFNFNPVGLTMEDTFKRVIAYLKEIEDPARRAAIATDLFGKSGLKMADIGEKMKAFGGGMVDSQNVATLAEGQRQFNSIWGRLKTSMA